MPRLNSDPSLLKEDHDDSNQNQADHQAEANGKEQETQFPSPQRAIDPGK
jgi:hypothetical protein